MRTFRLYLINKKHLAVPVLYCYARCPNLPTGKDKTSMTVQHAKEGKFIADSSQGPCCNQRSGAKSESLEPQFPHTFIGCSISNISSGWWVQVDWLHVCKAILLVQTFKHAELSRGPSRRFTGCVLISWSLVAC